jgi:hypothetical protein
LRTQAQRRAPRRRLPILSLAAAPGDGPPQARLRGRLAALTFLFALALHPTSGAVLPAVPAAGLSATDRLYLKRLGEALALSRAAAGKIWPGWSLEKTPLLIYVPGRVAYLVNHPNPPPDFTVLEGKLPLPVPVFMKSGRDPRFNANTSVDLGGIPTACIGYSDSPADSEGPSLRFIALVFHEGFHAYQARVGRPGKGSVEAILLRYPDLNAENLALAQMEQMALFQSIRFDDLPDPDRVRGFLAIRRARLKTLGAEFLRGERGIEYQEGIPTYVEVRVLEEARKLAAASQGIGEDDPYSLRLDTAPELRAGDYYGRLLRFSSDAGAIRTRSYGTGMALALVLDRMGVDWKTAVLTGEKYLDELLADALPTAASTDAALLARAQKEYGYGELLRLVQDKVGRVAAERKKAARAFFEQEGVQVVLKLPEAPVEVRSFDPLNVQVIDSSTAIHRRMLSLACGEITFYASGVPVLVGLGQGPFDIRSATVFVPADELKVEADFAPLPLQPGPHAFASSLTVSGGGISLRGSSGTATVSPDGLKVEISLKR